MGEHLFNIVVTSQRFFIFVNICYAITGSRENRRKWYNERRVEPDVLADGLQSF